MKIVGRKCTFSKIKSLNKVKAWTGATTLFILQTVLYFLEINTIHKHKDFSIILSIFIFI